MEDSYGGHIIDDDAGIRALLQRAQRVAVLGMKPESREHKPAFYVPAYLQRAGYDVIPVPVYYPELQQILGRPVYRRVVDVPPPIDLLVLFRRAEDIPQHEADILAARPRAVWFQLGIRNDNVARHLAQAGMDVVQDRCTMVEHRRLIGGP